MFCKVFESKKFGQIVAMRDTNNQDNPCIKLYVEPETMGICTTVLGYNEEDDGYAKRDAVFDALTLEKSEIYVTPVFEFVI